MMIDHRQHHLDTLRAGLSVIIYPLQQTANLPNTAGDWLAESFTSRRQLQEENAYLRTQQILLKGQIQKLEGLQAENMRLRELLDSSLQVGERVLIAEIMAIDLNPFSRQIVINKGSRSGVYVGQPILDAGGVMGQIVSVTPFTSIAMIISDPSHALPVVVNRNGLRGIAVGKGSANELDLPHIPNNADIRVGDLLITSGLGGRFPPGYPVARVTDVKKDLARRFAKVTAEATALLDRSREVLLVWHQPTVASFDNTDEECVNGEQDCDETTDAPAATDQENVN